MKIDNTIEKVAEETVKQCNESNIKVTKQDVYRVLNFLVDCIGLATNKCVPIEIPYIGKILPKVTVAPKEFIDYKSEEFKEEAIRMSKAKKKATSELKNQKAFTDKEADTLLEGYINKNLVSFKFAFNNETKTEFLTKLNVSSYKEIHTIHERQDKQE